MRSDEIIAVGLDSAGCTPGRSRGARPRFRLWTRGRIALLLGLIGSPWLPAFHDSREDLRMHRARGDSACPIESFAFSPDGRTIATADERGRVKLRAVNADPGIARDFGARAHARVISFSPDGGSLAIGSFEPGVVLADMGREGSGRLLGVSIRDVSALRFSPDGRTLAVSSYLSPEVVLWDVEAGRPSRTLRGHASPVLGLAFAPDGRSLASSGFPDPEILVTDLATGRARAFPTETFVTTHAFSRDGRLLATANAHARTVRLWDVGSGGPMRAIAGLALPVRSLAFSPDGRLLAMGAGDGFVDVWSVATGLELRRLDAQADVIRKIAFSPDGRFLAATGNDDDVRLWDVGEFTTTDSG